MDNENVIVSFACADALSGIRSCSGAQSFGEGTGQSATGTAVDNAGNQASVNINVDKTPPTLSGAPTASPNPAG